MTLNKHSTAGEVQRSVDVCTPTLVQRLAALLDQDPASIREGDALPRGWHVALFTESTPQSALRPDGVGGLGFTMPETGLPRLMAGGRRIQFHGDIVIGSRVVRASRVVSVVPKEARSGRIVVVTVRHEIAADGAPQILLTEEQDFIMRGEAPAAAPSHPPPKPAPAAASLPTARREVVASEVMLFRYCAITYNSHRIHYDRTYATEVEGYPDIVVNGGFSTLQLIELFKTVAGREPSRFQTRNVGPLYCNETIRLHAAEGKDGWRLWAENARGELSLDASAA